MRLPTGRRRVGYAKTAKEAERKRRALLAEVDAGRPVPLGRKPTVGDYLRRWLDVRLAGEVTAGHLEVSTADSYRQMVEGHLLPTFLGRVKLNALSTDDIREWQRVKLSEPSRRTKKGTVAKTLSARAVGMARGAAPGVERRPP